MENFSLFAQPWWVNFIILIPIIAFWRWRKKRLNLTKKQLIISAIFGIAFGFVEAAVVIYLRDVFGLLKDFSGTAADAAKLNSGESKNLFSVVEPIRNIATLVMLISVTFLTAKKNRERFAIFLWTFAFWDFFYYVWLRILIHWPASLTSPDVLFLLPVPWLAQVWFPLLVSGLMIVVIVISSRASKAEIG